MLGLKRKTWSTIVEIAICVILLPYFAVILKLIVPDNPGEVFYGLLSELSFMEVWFDILKDLFISGDMQVNFENYFNNWLTIMGQASFQIYIIAIVSEIVEGILEKLNVTGIPILLNVIIVLLSCGLTNLTQERLEYIIAEIAILMIIYMVVLFFISRLSFFKKIIKLLVGLTIQTIVVCSACAYVCNLSMIAVGFYKSTFEIVMSVLVTFTIMFVVLVGDYMLSKILK